MRCRCINSGPNPRSPVEAFTAAWVAGDYHTMYRQLAPQSRAATTYRAFRRAYAQAATVSTLKSLKVTGPGVMAAGVDTAPMALRTRLFGRLHARLQVPLVLSGSRYLISWSPELVWPGLQPGEQLVSSAQAARPPGSDPGHQPFGAGPRPGRRPRVSAGQPPFYSSPATVRAPQTAADRRKRRGAGLAGQRQATVRADSSSRSTRCWAASRRSRCRRGAPPATRLIAHRPGRRPHDVVTTLDPTLQTDATDALGGRLGGIMIMDARNGAVRAAAGLGDGRRAAARLDLQDGDRVGRPDEGRGNPREQLHPGPLRAGRRLQADQLPPRAVRRHAGAGVCPELQLGVRAGRRRHRRQAAGATRRCRSGSTPARTWPTRWTRA